MKEHLPKLIKFLSGIAPRLIAGYALKKFATPTRVPRPESEMEMYASSKKFFLKSGIAAFEWGNPKGPLVMLIHGWNGRGTQISAFARPMIDKGYRIVALDGPGHGISPAPSKGMTNPSHYADFILHSQQELDPNGALSVIAHSFGGGSTVLAASRGLKTRSLVLVASPAFYDRVVQFFSSNFGLSKKSEEVFVKKIAEFAGLHPRELNIGRIGSTLGIPVLVVHDENDTAVNFLSATAITEAWPGAELYTTQGLGHRRILKDAQVIRYVSDFIGRFSNQ